MATQIVEIPVSSIDQEPPTSTSTNPSNAIPSNDKEKRKFSIDIDNFLTTDFPDYIKEDRSNGLHSVRRQDSNESVSSVSSFYSVDFDDYQNNLLYSDDLDADFMSPFSLSFPESPSIDELSRNFTGLAAKNDDDVSNFRRSQKNEKVENNEEESSSDSSSDSDSSDGSISDVATIKKELEEEEYQEGIQDEPDVKDDDDEEYRPVKKRIIGIQKNDSFSSVTSYSSGASDSDELDEAEYDEDDDDAAQSGNYEPLTKRYKQPLSLRAENLKIGNWSLQDFSSEVSEDGIPLDVTLDIKILFGRRKIKYEICKPNKVSKTKTTLVVDFPFSQISGLDFRAQEQTIVFHLSEPPIFTKKEKGKCGRIDDFTNGNASTYPRHHIYVQSAANFVEYKDRLLSCDRRLRQLAKVGLSPVESTFPNSENRTSAVPVCEWDKENKASKRCEVCNANYCDVCDDVLHRNASHKTHKRVPVTIVLKPIPVPTKPKKPTIKKRKKMNNDRCRCGTGATKGTLGEPCTGNRCPCFSNGKSCVNCGCKNCSNPIKKSSKSGGRGSQEIRV